MDIATVSAAWAALTTARNVGKGLLDLRIDTEVRLKISEMLDRLGDAQDRLFQFRDDLDKLQAENRSLREQLAASTDWNIRYGQYSLIKTDGGAVVYESQHDLKHYACPSCMDSKSIQPLQDARNYPGTFICPKCDKHFPSRPPRNPPRRQAQVIIP